MNSIDAPELPFPRVPSERPVEDTLVRRRPDGRSFSGRHVDLDEVDIARHAGELYDAGHRNEASLRVWEYLSMGPWPSEAAFSDWLADHKANSGRVIYALRPKTTRRAAGMAAFMEIEPQHATIEIGGIWLGQDLQRTRAATEALFMMMCHAFDDLHYRRLQWRCNALNRRSRAAARRLGFRFEGIFFNHMIVRGENRDTAFYSIIDTEWQDARAIIATWLDDANFDEIGSPRRSLTEMMAPRHQTPVRNAYTDDYTEYD